MVVSFGGIRRNIPFKKKGVNSHTSVEVKLQKPLKNIVPSLNKGRHVSENLQ